MPTIRRTRSASTTISPSCGSCPRRPFCRTAAPGAACRSCFLNSVDDSLNGIVDTWNENVWLASRGGGIGTYWGNVRGIGEPVGLNGKTSGIIPFVRVMDSLTLAISQGSLRRGSAACYLDVSAPGDRGVPRDPQAVGRLQPQGAQPAPRRADDRRFMEAVRNGKEWICARPRTSRARRVDARSLFQKLVETRLATGEPYIVFADHVNKNDAQASPRSGLKVSTSNLCSEITLPTGKDHLGNAHRGLLPVVAQPRDLGRVEGREGLHRGRDAFPRQCPAGFIDRAEPGMERAAIRPARERSVGLGVMGFHSFLQARGLPFEGAMAKSWNLRMFKHIKAQVDEASMQLAIERGPCPDAADMGVMERFSCKMAIAPTASISIICGGTSACIEPIPANIYTHKTLSGSFSIKNPYLEKLLSREEQEFGRGVEHDPRTGRLSPASRFPQPRGKGLLQDQLRDRPALADRACRRPHALYRPVASR
jgi:ribonucleoside-diphosphate reductase alpha chain